jgi:hypothetical protein
VEEDFESVEPKKNVLKITGIRARYKKITLKVTSYYKFTEQICPDPQLVSDPDPH